MREPVWPSVQSIVEFDQEVVAETGEPHGVLNELGVASAVEMPRNAWHYSGERDLLVLAGKLLMGIARNHPFRQGNKRSALVAAIAFLEANGVEVLDITMRPKRSRSWSSRRSSTGPTTSSRTGFAGS